MYSFIVLYVFGIMLCVMELLQIKFGIFECSVWNYCRLNLVSLSVQWRLPFYKLKLFISKKKKKKKKKKNCR